MEENLRKQKIQDAFTEPAAPQELVSAVILRVQAVTMGKEAQKQLECAQEQDVGALAARALIGQLATVSNLPSGAHPEQLARQLLHEPAFEAALCGGNVLRRIHSGEMMQQIVNQQPEEQRIPEIPKKDVPVL